MPTVILGVTLPNVHLRIHPAFDPSYYSFYFEGFRRSGAEIELTTEGFPPPDNADFYGRRQCMAVQLVTRSGIKRLVIAANDLPEVSPANLSWCDRLGKANLKLDDPHLDDRRVIPIGPSFGVRAWNLPESLKMVWGTSQQRLTGLFPFGSARLYFDTYRKRLAESAFVPARSEPDYLFYSSWPWTRHPEVNPPRAEYIRVCKRQNGANFEGGFSPRRRGNLPEFRDVMAARRYPLKRYLENVQRSVAVFNNPAPHGCLGWKLGEFLALGKAIITLPLDRALPAPLEDGVTVLLVDGSPEQLEDALKRIRSDVSLRSQLESNARHYYDHWLKPEVVTRRLLAGWID